MNSTAAKPPTKKFDYYIKCPIHKEINFTKDPWIAEFAFTFELKRLKEIKQLGVAYKVFPSANNNRYSHSLGTFCIAQKFANKFANEISLAERKMFLLAALLHDIGHGPFSHVFEKISKIPHEKLTQAIITSKQLSIRNLLLKNEVDPDELATIYEGKSAHKWINRLISSNLDVDRIDYMLRDSYYVGAKYSTIDVDFLIEHARLINKDIYFSINAKNYIESFLLGRFFMHDDIFENKNGYIYEWALQMIFERLKEIKKTFVAHQTKLAFYDFFSWIVFEETPTVELFIQLNDFNLLAFLFSLLTLQDGVLTGLVNSFFYETNIEVVNWTPETLAFCQQQIAKQPALKQLEKYCYGEIYKSQKKVFLDGEKNAINLFDHIFQKHLQFDSNRILKFNERNDNLSKILIINKNLLCQ